MTCTDRAATCTDRDVTRAAAAAWPADEPRSAAIWSHLCAALGEFVAGTGASGVVVGLSGGIDSAVVATLAVDALGAHRVRGVAMPGPYSSPSSLRDAEDLAANLGVRVDVADICAAFDATVAALVPGVVPDASGVAFENAQARLRGMFLLTVANADDALVLNTQNRTEALVGYSTLHGDMVGAVAPIGAVFKTDVFSLARWRNAAAVAPRAPIPPHSIARAPSAELAPDQFDTDALWPFEVLDVVLAATAAGATPAEAAAAARVDVAVVEAIGSRVAASRFKDAFAAPALVLPAHLDPPVRTGPHR